MGNKGEVSPQRRGNSTPNVRGEQKRGRGVYQGWSQVLRAEASSHGHISLASADLGPVSFLPSATTTAREAKLVILRPGSAPAGAGMLLRCLLRVAGGQVRQNTDAIP